ncbi:hypothetical protein FIBSPDRAFT_951223 [Athelia psychrophila]|uniref:Prolyl 4-hydroxylase alpha subunit Fe(2+) 2OG dioxygenase domain-containing protein n=1 Tax=Athelia psychrophila TaxID=1759441 RepID=A0A166MYX3_9AGAM|nr:hypothetical protein FIBSPDRAFT_951223 [Fibularhizoctonia sp. CBS 109695]
MSTQSLVDKLKASLSARTPFVTGTYAAPADDFNLYYNLGDSDDARHIDLSKATSAQLQGLADACQPATFGLDKQDVLDESYRKAGKMDTSNFSSKFDIERSGIIDHVRDGLVPGQGDVRVELYKLNVYGKDSFFKAHKDTPRGADMFGSLVIFFPCEQTGGALLLRHEGREWSFGSTKELSECADPSVGYVAFYSDVEHEVALVTSGHRVTLTYNLYHEPDVAPEHPLAVRQASTADAGIEAACKAALLGLLDDSTILPEGGILAFGLQHEYPVDEYQASPAALLNHLKGPDALFKRICNQLYIGPKLVCVYNDGYSEAGSMLSHGFIDLSDNDQIEDLEGELLDHGAVTIRDVSAQQCHEDIYDRKKPLDIYWVFQPTENTSLTASYIHYGNEATLSHYYAKVSLIIGVGPVGNRILPLSLNAMKAELLRLNSELEAASVSGADSGEIVRRCEELREKIESKK